MHSVPACVCVLVSFLAAFPAAAQTVISMSPARAVEGNAGTMPVLLPLYLSAAAATQVTVNWTTADDSAVAGSDYTAASGTVTFAAGETFKTIAVSVAGDATAEYDEHFTVNLSSPSAATVGTAQVRVLIQNDEHPTTLKLPEQLSVFEKLQPGGDSLFATVGNAAAGRTATLSLTSGTAIAGTDITLGSTTLGLGGPDALLPLRPVDDTLEEPDESFVLTAAGSSPAVRLIPSSPRQTLSVSGNAPVTMDMDDEWLVTADGTDVRIYRRSGEGWTQTQTFAGASRGGVYAVSIDQGLIAADFLTPGVKIYELIDDAWTEQKTIPRMTTQADQRRRLVLSDDMLAVGDPGPEFSSTPGEVRVYERHLGGRNAWGQRQLLTAPMSRVDFGWSVDLWGPFVAVGAPSSSAGTIYRRNPATGAWSLARDFTQPFSGLGGACCINGEIAVFGSHSWLYVSRKTDQSGESWSAISSSDLYVFGANGLKLHGTTAAWSSGDQFGIVVSRADGALDRAGSVTVPRSGGFVQPHAFAMTANRLAVPAVTDTGVKLHFLEPGGVTGSLIDDDSVRFMISSTSVVEGSSFARVEVTLSRPLPVNASVLCTTVDGTARAGLDYPWMSTWLSFSAGNTLQPLYFQSYADGLVEAPETVQILLEYPSLGGVGPPGIITLTDTPPPTLILSTTSSSAVEGNSGSASVTFTALLSGPAGEGNSFSWTPISGSAVAGQDFPAGGGTVTFSAGATSATFQVPVTGDNICEPDESFSIQIGNAVGAVLSSPSTATIVIQNDDTGVPQPDSYTTAQDTVLSGMNVRHNDCSALSVTLAENVTRGTLVLNSSGAFVYTPGPNFIGTDTFSYNGGGSTGGGGGIPAGTDLVDGTSVFRWFNPLSGVDPATEFTGWNTGWFTAAWNDGSWGNGFGLMGYGTMSSSFGDLFPETDIGLPVNGQRRTAYFRHKFNVAQPGAYDLELSISRDDSAIVYLNGAEVLRSHETGAVNIRTAPDTWDLMIEGNTTAWTAGANEGDPNTHALNGINLIAGENTLAISGHNSLNPSSPTSSDLGIKVFHLRVTGGGGPPPTPIPVSITVTDGNIPPLLAADSYTLIEDSILDTVAAGRPAFLANDGLFSAAGTAFDPILEVSVQDETGGAVTSFNPATGHFVFNPARNYSGAASFRYRVRDKDGWSLPALVTITVTEDFPLAPLTRLNPQGSQLFRSVTSALTFPSAGVMDAAVALKAGQIVSLRASLTGTLSTLSVLDLAGTPLAGGTAGPNSLENVPVAADGTYIIAAGGVSGGAAGSLTVLVNGGLPDQPSSAAPYNLDAARPAGSVRAAVAAIMPPIGSSTHFYSFNGTVGETVQLYLHSSVGQSFTLISPPGIPAASSASSPHSGTASLLNYTLSASGLHRVEVAPVNAADFTLQLYRGTAAHEYSAVSQPLLKGTGAGHLQGPGGTETGITFAAFGDYGSASANELAVSQIVKSWNPDFIVTAGDHNYSSDYTVGSPSWTQRVGNFYGEFIKGRDDNRYSEQTSPIQRYFPSPGNHDSGPDVGNGGELSGYFDYFYENPGGAPRLPVGVFQPMLSYYKMNWGNIEFYMLDSDNGAVNPSANTAQREWLRQQLDTSTAQWKFAIFHHPPYSSSAVHGNQPFMQWGADFEGLTAIFTGHDHTYERLDIGNGVMQFITGLGGMSTYPLGFIQPESQFFYNSGFGAMKVRVGSAGVLFEFRGAGSPGGTLIDSYTIGIPPGQLVPSGTDTWSLRVLPGQTLLITTTTPAAPGSLTNTTNPALLLLDESGTTVTGDTGSAADGLNASLLYTVPAIPNCPPEGCLWNLKVWNEGGGSGEYNVNVSTAPAPADLYNVWVAVNLPAGQRAHAADPDGDGAPNLMEFMVDTNPAAAGPPPMRFVPAAAGLQSFHLAVPASWTRPVTVRLQSSPSLTSGTWTTHASRSAGGAWTGTGPLPEPAPGGGFLFTAPDGARLFYRLVFTLD